MIEEMSLQSWTAPIARAEKSRKTRTKVLENLQGFKAFYEGSIKPAIKGNPDENMVIVFVAEPGVGKETAMAEFNKMVEEDEDLWQWQDKEGVKLQLSHSCWGACLSEATKIQVRDYERKIGLIINPYDRKTGCIRENHDYSLLEYSRASRFWKYNLIYRRRTLPASTIILVESVAMVPDESTRQRRQIISPERKSPDLGFSAICALANHKNTFFIGLITDDKVQERARKFREKVATVKGKEAVSLLKEYNMVLDKNIEDNVDSFRRRMGTAQSTMAIRDLVHEEIFDLLRRTDSFNKRDELMRALQYSTPDHPKDFMDIFDPIKYPGRRAEILKYYLRDYLFEDVLKLPSERYFIGQNKFLSGEINFYRKSLEDRDLPLYWPSRFRL